MLSILLFWISLEFRLTLRTGKWRDRFVTRHSNDSRTGNKPGWFVLTDAGDSVLYSLYGIPVNEADIRKAENQLKNIDIAVNRNRKVKEIVAQLEAHYDARTSTRKKEELPKLSPEIENFLKEMERRFRQG